MFRSIWSKTLRDYRVPILSWGIGLGFLLFTVFTTSHDVVTSGYSQIAQQFRFFADPVAVDTPQGYATFRVMSLFLPVVLCIWTILEGAALVRSAEERSSIDLLLATPRSRTRVLLEKLVAFSIALVLIGLLIGLCAILGEASARITVDATRALLAGLQTSLIGFFFGALALLLSQVLRSRGAAAGWTAILMVLSFLLDDTGRVVNNGAWIQSISPFYYYDLNKPLIPTYPANFGATALLLGLGLVFAIVSILLFRVRDIGGVALPVWLLSRQGTHARRDALRQAQQDVFIRGIGLRALRAKATSTFWWIVGIAIFAGWITSLTRTIEEPLQKLMGSNSIYGKLFGGHDITTNAGFLAAIVFAFLPVLTVIFAFTMALAWPGDLDDGRLELILSAPKPRYRVLLERFAAVCLAAILALLVSWLTILAAASATDLTVDVGQTAAATFGILPLELIVIALVYILAGRLRAGTILGIVCAFIAVSYFAEFFRSLLNLPDWVLALSIFHQYSSPITDGLNWSAFFAMLGIAVVLLALGIFQFGRGDIQRGS